MRLEDRESNQARSKPDTVNQPLRTARIFVHHYNSTQYCSTESVFIYIHSPSSRPTSHLRCGQLEVSGASNVTLAMKVQRANQHCSVARNSQLTTSSISVCCQKCISQPTCTVSQKHTKLIIFVISFINVDQFL